jgi:hypothetical protein
LTNYTLDSFFGGERLVRPYSLYKATDKDSELINISDDEAKKIAGSTVAELLEGGRLFAVDRECSSLASYDLANLAQTDTKPTKPPTCLPNSTTNTGPLLLHSFT